MKAKEERIKRREIEQELKREEKQKVLIKNLYISNNKLIWKKKDGIDSNTDNVVLKKKQNVLIIKLIKKLYISHNKLI